jgi:hypothetical protein
VLVSALTQVGSGTQRNFGSHPMLGCFSSGSTAHSVPRSPGPVRSKATAVLRPRDPRQAVRVAARQGGRRPGWQPDRAAGGQGGSQTGRQAARGAASARSKLLVMRQRRPLAQRGGRSHLNLAAAPVDPMPGAHSFHDPSRVGQMPTWVPSGPVWGVSLSTGGLCGMQSNQRYPLQYQGGRSGQQGLWPSSSSEATQQGHLAGQLLDPKQGKLQGKMQGRAAA